MLVCVCVVVLGCNSQGYFLGHGARCVRDTDLESPRPGRLGRLRLFVSSFFRGFSLSFSACRSISGAMLARYLGRLIAG